MAKGSGKKVAYIYDAAIGDFEYQPGHEMKPHRIRITDTIVQEYGLYEHMECYRSHKATELEMTQFHTDEYIEYLKRITPETSDLFKTEQDRYNCGSDFDSPIFDDLFNFCRITAGGTMNGAVLLGDQKHEIAINWAGGLHHARKDQASGFCHVNDIVLGILELLRKFKRVVYIDIDVHHGDGVEEAFYTTDRVMTVSFHNYGGGFFPTTGHILDIGAMRGMNYAVNVPLRHGIDDESYRSMFEPIVGAVMECYRPEAIVIQCGADSLAGDHLGPFNLSMKGHANCLEFVKSFNLPLLVLGGGGYTVPNVAKTWAYETGVCVGLELSPVMPKKPEYPNYDNGTPPQWQGWKKPFNYYNYFAPNFELDVRSSNQPNRNSKQYLDKVRTMVIENIRRTKIFVPSVQMSQVPEDRKDIGGVKHDADEDENSDALKTQYREQKHMVDAGDYLPDSGNDMEDIQQNSTRKNQQPDPEVEAAETAEATLSLLTLSRDTPHYTSREIGDTIEAAKNLMQLSWHVSPDAEQRRDQVVVKFAAPIEVSHESLHDGMEDRQFGVQSQPDVVKQHDRMAKIVEGPSHRSAYISPYASQKSGSSNDYGRRAQTAMGPPPRPMGPPEKPAYVSPYSNQNSRGNSEKRSSGGSSNEFGSWYQRVETNTLSDISRARGPGMAPMIANKAVAETECGEDVDGE